MERNKIFFVTLILAMLVLSGTAAAQNEEHRKLADEKNALYEKIQQLKAEQDFLLFQKVLSSSDSKYLILDMTAGKGELRYKNRVLRDYPLISTGETLPHQKQGTVVLTKKIEGPRRKYALVFGKSIILQPKGATAYREEGILRIALPKKDFMALYYALESGALAYVRP